MASPPAELAVRPGTPVKVAVVSPYAVDQPGGVQDQVMEISLRLAGHGIESWVVAPGLSGPPGARLVGRALTVPANGSRAPIAVNPSTLRRVGEAVEGADVVHLHEPLMPLVGWGLLRKVAIPTVGTFHADPSTLVRAAYRRLGPITRRLVRGLAIVTAVSEVAASAVRSLRPDLKIIPNAVDVGQYRGELDKKPRRIVFLGRDEPRKGLDLLLAAWPDIIRKVPGAELDVIGADRAEPLRGVRFHGRVADSEKRSILGEASVFVAPNLGGESFGITLLEGMAAGCAVVASDLPAFQAVGGDAVEFFPRGNVDGLATKVAGLLLDEKRRVGVAEAGMRRSEIYDWTTVLPAYIDLYQSALCGP